MTDTVTQAARLKAADLLAQYADFIRHSVKADELEAHPYLPEIERVVDDLRAATTAWNTRDGGAATTMREAGTASSVPSEHMIDMANVGESLMEAIRDYSSHEFLKGWHPADCPTEIVGDLLNALDEALANTPAASSVGADDLYRAQEIFESIGITASGCASAHGDPGGGLEMIAGYAEDGFRLLADRLAALAASSHPASAKQHPDLAGHIADAVRDACNIVLGKVVSFDDSRAIAATILDRINIANAQINPASAGDEGLRNVLWQARDTIVQHHQWHAAQTDPDPEHGFIPADEYVDSSLYERTIAAIGAVDKLLETGPRDLEALSATPAQEVDETERAIDDGLVTRFRSALRFAASHSVISSADEHALLAALAPEGDAR
jgi:hypothetical protein